MIQRQVLNEIEKSVDCVNPRDILLSRNQSDAVERQMVEGAASESIYATALQPHYNGGRTSEPRKG